MGNDKDVGKPVAHQVKIAIRRASRLGRRARLAPSPEARGRGSAVPRLALEARRGPAGVGREKTGKPIDQAVAAAGPKAPRALDKAGQRPCEKLRQAGRATEDAGARARKPCRALARNTRPHPQSRGDHPQ